MRRGIRRFVWNLEMPSPIHAISGDTLLIRYHTGPDGKPVKKAIVYTQKEHGIAQRTVDHDAVRIVERLRQNGHATYIVGGAVRDLLLGRIPKDYDIVTDAEPARIKRLFYRSRIIGKRFRLVHVYAGPRIFEVSTFRSITNGTIGNTYGTIDEDALRRDFSMNALYFDPIEGTLVDYVNGLRDIRAMRVVPVIPLKTIFTEDPVRMLRAVKYAVATGFTIPLTTRMAIRRHAPELKSASISRLGEEAVKIFSSAKALPIIETLARYRLLDAILPGIARVLASGGNDAVALRRYLSELDESVTETGDKSLRRLLAYVIKLPVEKASMAQALDVQAAYYEALAAAREFLSPLTMPRVEVEAAVEAIFVAPEALPKVKKPRKRGRRKPAAVKHAETLARMDIPAAAKTAMKNFVSAPAMRASREERQPLDDTAAPGEGTSRSAKRRRRRRKSGNGSDG
ncbi:MAG: polynucleotide adenylyltransferase PcnB, partial [Spirochaetales bacterium]